MKHPDAKPDCERCKGKGILDDGETSPVYIDCECTKRHKKGDEMSEIEDKKTYVFYGCSDDTFGEYNITNDDYDNCASNEPIRWRLKDSNGYGYFIDGQYSEKQSGCWSIRVEPIEENRNPNWPMRFANPSEYRATPYSMVLVVDAPCDATLVSLEREGGE
ncbi:hypothetical protein KS4_18370 [Poriferisphaera corsica]|uniref:Uncharacterized protein n=1 Tax=Poriferisphaera corsica TaxID=2528020 RepID=A0A517YU69_9BACT|nr:hypothetical protein [Poriferisphaera corsica]QDU33780.1 hypothetical protein KS4_18370 [Poriferisphaera corsica]